MMKVDMETSYTKIVENECRVGVLSTLNAPLLGYILNELQNRQIVVSAVILDSKDVSKKDMMIHHERTNGRLPLISLFELTSTVTPFYFVKSHNSEYCCNLVRALNLELLINAGTPRILNKQILTASARGILNCHPGLLPEFRGCTCVEWAIYLNKPVGNTVHFMTEAIDEGPIVLQRPTIIPKGSTYSDIRTKVYCNGVKLLAEGVKKVLEKRISAFSLPLQGKGHYYSVIEDDKMATVHQILKEGRYSHFG